MDQSVIDAALVRHAPLLDGTWESAARVTQRVCWDLRSEYALIRKNGGTRCDGPGGSVDCDKVIHRQTFDIYDVVIQGGSTSNAIGWLYEGRFPNHAGDLVEPESYLGAGNGGGGGTQPQPQPCRWSAEAPTQILELLQGIRLQLSTLAAAVEELRMDQDRLGAQGALLLAEVEALHQKLSSPGLQIRASAKLSGRIEGTAKL